jgi:hypothetical protein
MDLNTFQGLTEAYSAVYDEELRTELLSIEEDFSIIDDFSDEELIDVMEDIFRNNEFQIEECFDILSEATVTYGQGSRMAASSRLADMKQKKKESRIGRIKQAATSALERVKKAPSAARKYVSGKISSAREKIAGALRSAAQRVDTKPKATAERTPSTYRGAGVGTKERVSSGSYSAPSRNKPTSAKIQDPWGSATTPKATTPKATTPKATTPKATTKKTRFGSNKNIKPSGEAAYQAAKAKMAEDISVYDIVLEHLISEGYADSVNQAEVIMVNMSEEWREDIMEKTAMAKRGLDEPAIRTQIAKSTGGGEAADRATALADKPTYGQRGVNPAARENLARTQRGDFRKTNSSNPGLKGYAHKSNDPDVKAKQAARGAQRGFATLTPNERK